MNLINVNLTIVITNMITCGAAGESGQKMNWADIWGMKFNPSKCSVLRVKRPRAKETTSDYQLKGVTLGQVQIHLTWESASVRTGNGGITSPKLRVRLIPHWVS